MTSVIPPPAVSGTLEQARGTIEARGGNHDHERIERIAPHVRQGIAGRPGACRRCRIDRAVRLRAEGREAPQARRGRIDRQISWSQCNVNCGGNCVFQWHSQDGKIVYMESDNTGDVDLQARACLRGRSMRRWINSPDRLTKPMKRVGKRGEGKFEQISWDEAVDTIASELKRIIDEYGNESVYIPYATGVSSTTLARCRVS